MIRNIMEASLKDELRVLAIKTRNRLQLTQREMANKFEMSESSYSDIETGVFMCGTLTTMLLLSEQDDPKSVLNDLKVKLEESIQRERE